MLTGEEGVSKREEGVIIPMQQTNEAGGKFSLEITFPVGVDSIFAYATTTCGNAGIFSHVSNLHRLGRLERGQTVDAGEITMSCK